MTVAIRKAEAADARGIAEVQVRTWRAAYKDVVRQEFLDSLSVDQRASMWESAARDDALDLLVVERRRRVVGFVCSGPARDEAEIGEIYAIYVEPEAWGTGCGRALMVESLVLLSRRGFGEVTLWVLEDNPRARRFYESGGWRVDGFRREVIGGADLPEVRYRLVLPAMSQGTATIA